MSDAPAPRVPFVKAAQLVIYGLLAGLVVGAGFAGWVWWQGQQQLTEQLDVNQTQAAELNKVRADSEQQAADMARSISRLEARADIARALQELDNRNFGVVGERLSQAAAHLEGDADAASLVQAIGNVTVAASEDLAGPRARLTDLARQADTLLAKGG